VFNLPKLKINLLGEHQLYNAATALYALEIIRQSGYNVTENSIIQGFLSCHFAGRFEIINKEPMIILDGGHNINGIEYFSKAVKEYFSDKKVILFYGMLEDKNPNDVIDYLISLSKEIYTLTPNNPRAMSSNDIANLIKKHSDIKVTPIQKYDEIFNILKSFDKNEIIAFVGSLYMIGDVRTLLKKTEFFTL